MTPMLCLALAFALGQPVDLRPEWRPDFAPIPQQAQPRPVDDTGPFGARTGQVTLRGCIDRPEAQRRLQSAGYRRVTVAALDDGKFYEHWSRPDGRWESGISDPATNWFCPLFKGPGWLFFVPADR